MHSRLTLQLADRRDHELRAAAGRYRQRCPAPAPCQAPRRMGIGHNRPHAGPRIRRCLRAATWPHPAARLLPIVKYTASGDALQVTRTRSSYPRRTVTFGTARRRA